MTVAYVKKGAAAPFVGDTSFAGCALIFPTVIFSARNRSQTPLPCMVPALRRFITEPELREYARRVAPRFVLSGAAVSSLAKSLLAKSQLALFGDAGKTPLKGKHRVGGKGAAHKGSRWSDVGSPSCELKNIEPVDNILQRSPDAEYILEAGEDRHQWYLAHASRNDFSNKFSDDDISSNSDEEAERNSSIRQWAKDRGGLQHALFESPPLAELRNNKLSVLDGWHRAKIAFEDGERSIPVLYFEAKAPGVTLAKSLRAFTPGEDCPHCGASMEQGDDGKCNACRKPWPGEVDADPGLSGDGGQGWHCPWCNEVNCSDGPETGRRCYKCKQTVDVIDAGDRVGHKPGSWLVVAAPPADSPLRTPQRRRNGDGQHRLAKGIRLVVSAEQLRELAKAIPNRKDTYHYEEGGDGKRHRRLGKGQKPARSAESPKKKSEFDPTAEAHQTPRVKRGQKSRALTSRDIVKAFQQLGVESRMVNRKYHMAWHVRPGDLIRLICGEQGNVTKGGAGGYEFRKRFYERAQRHDFDLTKLPGYEEERVRHFNLIRELFTNPDWVRLTYGKHGPRYAFGKKLKGSRYLLWVGFDDARTDRPRDPEIKAAHLRELEPVSFHIDERLNEAIYHEINEWGEIIDDPKKRKGTPGE